VPFKEELKIMRKLLFGLSLLLLCFSTAVSYQDKLGHLKSWDGKSSRQLDQTGKITSDFFALPEIRTRLRRQLNGADYNLVIRAYSAGSPLKQMGDILASRAACFPPVGTHCPNGRAGVAINLRTGAIYVRMQRGTSVRWSVSSGKQDLAKDVQDYISEPVK
jgi:hypothetical protein